MNDSWPVVSWAIADHYEKPKMAFYVIARDMKPLVTGVAREPRIARKPNLQHEAFCRGKTKADAAGVIAHATPHVYPPKKSSYSVWIANSTTETQSVRIRVRFISVVTGTELQGTFEQEVAAKATGSTEVTTGSTPEEEPTVVVSEIFDSRGNLLSHDVDWPQPLKHLKFPQRNVKIEAAGHEELTVTAERPVKGLMFTNTGVQWSDNCLDVVPGQKLTIKAIGLSEPPKWTYYGCEDE